MTPFFRKAISLFLFSAACAFSPRASAQMYDAANRLSHVRNDTLMWSLADPFAFQTTSNLISRTDALSNGVAAANVQIEAGVDSLLAEMYRARLAEAALAAYTNRADTALQAGATNAVYAHYGPRVSALEALTNAAATALQPAATNAVYAHYGPRVSALEALTNAAATALQPAATNAVYAYYNPRISALAAYTNKADTALQPASTNGWNTLPFLDWVLRSEVVGLVASAVEDQLSADLDQLPGFSNTVYAAVLPKLGERWHTDAPATPAAYFTYETNALGGIVITDYTPQFSAETHLRIPSRIGGLPVVAIGYDAFNASTIILESIVLPETLRDIGAQSFNSLLVMNTRLVIPASVTNVGAYAFWHLGAAMTNRMILFEGDMPAIGAGAFTNPYGPVTVLRRSGTSGWENFGSYSGAGLATIGPAEAVVLNGTTNLVSGGIVDLGSVTDSAAEKLDRLGGTSTNQVLQSATVPDKMRFGDAFVDALLEREVAWDPNWMTLRVGLGDGVEGQLFQELHLPAKNVSGQIITNGMAVRLSGAVGNSNKLEVTLAVADGSVRPSYMLGVATEDIAVGAFGRITWFGNVSQIDTTGALYGETGWTNNMPVFVSTNKPGYITRYEPQAPQPRISVGAVVNRHAQNGAILVRPTWGMKITDADDVDGTPLTATGQIMVWDNVRKVFDFTDNINNYASASTLATQRVERVWSPDGTEYRDGTGGVWRVVSVPQGYWTLSVLGTEYGTATNAYYEIRTAPFDFWNYDRGYGDGDAYFSWHVNTENSGQGQIYVEIQGEEGAHDGFLETNQVASGSIDFATSIYHTMIRLAWSNEAPTIATQHVATVALDTSLTGLATRAELAPYVSGTVMTQATSHVMAQHYDEYGYVTQQVLRVGDQIVTNRWVELGSRGATNITDGVTQGTYNEETRTFNISAITGKAITNGQSGSVTLGGVTMDTGNSSSPGGVVISGKQNGAGGEFKAWQGDANNYLSFKTDVPSLKSGLYRGSMGFPMYYDLGTGDTVLDVVYSAGIIRLAIGGINKVTINDSYASFTVDISAKGVVKFGPTISGKQAHIFTDGTNCYFVNVNSVTNALTTN